MSGIRQLFFAALFLLIGVSVHAQNPAAPTPPKTPELTAEAKIEAALSRKVSLDVTDEPLHEVLKSLANQAQVPFVITKKIEDAGVQRNQPVTLTLKDISLRSMLRNLLSNLDLTFTVKDEVLKITTIEDSLSPENMLTRVFPVKDLVTTGNKLPSGETELDFAPLVELITVNLEPDSWQDVGGPGSVHEFANAGALVVSSRQEIHERLEKLLAALRKTKELQALPAKPAATGAKASELPVSVALVRELEDQNHIEAALAKPVTYGFRDVPLKEVISTIGKDLKIPILLTKKIEDAGVTPDQPVNIALEKVSLRSFLRLLLGDLNLTFTVQDEVLKVTTVEDAQSPENMIVRVYPVRDLAEWPAKVAGGRPELDFGPLCELIYCIEPDSWGDGGRGGPKEDPATASIVVAHREDIHEKIADLLTQLRKVKTAQGLDRPIDTVPKLTVPPPPTRPAAAPR